MAKSNRYVSYLATEIEPRALSTLSQFERATEKAFDRISAFNNKGASRLGVSGVAGFTPAARTAITQTTTALSGAQAAASRTAPAMAAVAKETNAAATAFFRSAQALNVVQGPLGPLAGRLSSLGYIFRDLAGLSLAGVLGGGGAFAIGSIASSYQKVTDRLRPFYDSQVQANSALRDVINIAKQTRQALDPVAQLYSRLDVAGKANNVGANTARLTETVAKAARLSGGDANAQEAGLTQFAQGFGSGTLGGDELKSIRENTFRLAKALADGLGVPIAKLKELGAEGKLTPKVIAEALARSADQIDVEFSRLPKRIGQALTEAQNNLSIFLGRLDDASGATLGFAKAISFLGNNIGGAVTGIAAFAAVFAARSLSAPIAAANTALERFIANQALISQARRGAPVTLLTPTGIAKAKANSALDTEAAKASAADANARAQRAAAFSVDQQLAKARETLAVEIGKQRTMEQAGRESLVFANARVSAAQQELAVLAQVTAARNASDQAAALAARNRERAIAAGVRGQVTRATTALALNDEAGSATGGTRADRNRAAAVAARQRIVLESELGQALDRQAAADARLAAAEAHLAAVRSASRVPTEAQIAATERLAAAELALTTATEAQAVSAAASGNIANANAARAVTVLSLTEKQIAQQAALTIANRQVTLSNIALQISSGAAAKAQAAFTAATSLGTRAIGLLSRAGSAMSALLGGPVGIALTAVTVGMVGLATRTDEAIDASQRFNAAQDELASKLATSSVAFEKAARGAAAYRLELAQTGLAEAKKRQRDAQTSLGSSLSEASARIDLSSAQGRRDFLLTRRLASAALNGDNSSGVLRLSTIQALRARNPNAFADSSIAGFVGANPADVGIKTVGVKQTSNEIGDAQRAIDEAKRRLATPVKPAPLLGAGGVRRTDAELDADAALYSAGGTKAVQAQRAFNATAAKLRAERERMQKEGTFDAKAEDAYVTALGNAQSKLDGVRAGERAATAARAAGTRATNEATAATKARIAREEKLATILQRYSGEDSPVNAGRNAQRQVEQLFQKVNKGGSISDIPTITVDGEAITKAQALAKIVEGMNRPYNDLVRNQQRSIDVGNLRLRGLGGEADLLEQQLELERSLGISRERGEKLSDTQVATLRRQYVEQLRLNDATEARNRLIEIQAGAYSALIGAVRDIAAKPLDFSNIKNVVTSLKDQFQQLVAQQFVLKLFGDPEKAFRDGLTRGLDASAVKLTETSTVLTTSADNLTTSATTLKEAAADLKAAATTMASGGAPAAAAAGVPQLAVNLEDLQDTIAVAGDQIGDFGNEVRVLAASRTTANKAPAEDPAKVGIEKRFNMVGKELSTKVFGANSPLTRAASKLGTFLAGTQYAPVGTAATSLLGVKGSSLGAAIGGGLGKTLLGGDNGIFAKGLGAISSKLGSFAGPLGSIAGSVIGSVVGGLFKKVDTGAAVITSATGTAATSGKLGAEAGASAKSIQNSISSIATALGGTLGDFAVSIGKRENYFRVSASGSSTVGDKRPSSDAALIYNGTDEATAINLAIRNALEDGAVKGIREGARRLLLAGSDIDAALQKALAFTNVFRELKALKDPVGAAIDDLNLQFTTLISTFNEAGASAQEFADLQELYDLKRADAIKNATNSSLDSIQSFITGLTSGSDSPLSRRTVYDNAKTAVDGYRDQLAAGKLVDSEKLLAALGNLQSASGALNGSRGAFYSDFTDILALAEKAKSNITSAQSSSLAPSPFDARAAANLDAIAAATAQAAASSAQLVALLKANGGSYGTGGADGSSLSYLPSYYTG